MSRTQIITIVVIGALLVVPAPVFLFTIFLSGDSCCGENTSGAMTVATSIIIGLNLVGSSVMHLFARLVRRDLAEERFLPGVILSAAPTSAFYLVFLALIVTTAW